MKNITTVRWYPVECYVCNWKGLSIDIEHGFCPKCKDTTLKKY